MVEKSSEHIHSVSELTRLVRGLLETHVGEVWVEGEISNLRKQASGHQYFTLKDADAQLSCVLFRGNASRLRGLRLEDGQQVQAFGELSVYEARGQYQLICRLIQPKGIGALQAKFEALKRKLETEGLFDPSSKQPIPRFPRTIAVVTSPTGAALRDMLNILGRRAPWVRILVYPVRVQGKGAEVEIAEAIGRISAASGKQLPTIDTLVVGRGGGSIEDLWNFNEEIVARAIHACTIPVVSAVGHEIDFTIADFAADLRAPTPSAAAELIVPDKEELEARLGKLEITMRQDVLAVLEHHRKVLELTARGALSREPMRVLQEYQQEIDYLGDSLTTSAGNFLERFIAKAVHAARVLEMCRPERALAQRHERFVLLREKLLRSTSHLLQRDSEKLKALSSLLRSLGPEAVFARGFSLTTDVEGTTITDAAAVSPGQSVRTRVAKGEFDSTVT